MVLRALIIALLTLAGMFNGAVAAWCSDDECHGLTDPAALAFEGACCSDTSAGGVASVADCCTKLQFPGADWLPAAGAERLVPEPVMRAAAVAPSVPSAGESHRFVPSGLTDPPRLARDQWRAALQVRLL